MAVLTANQKWARWSITTHPQNTSFAYLNLNQPPLAHPCPFNCLAGRVVRETRLWNGNRSVVCRPRSRKAYRSANMGCSQWTRQVFRLRKLPSRVRGPPEAAVLLAGALSIAPGSMVVYSVAETVDRWESPRTKVATLQFKTVPSSLKGSLKANEWEIPCADAPGGVLILDIHFEGMTVLHDADLGTHHTEYAVIIIVYCIASLMGRLADHNYPA